MTENKGNKIASDYIAENFEPTDRLALLLVKKSAGSVIQRLADARSIAADVQDWLWEHNLRGYEVYISMNPVHPGATGRTKEDVACVRHLYLDFDRDGTAAVERLLNRGDLPAPNYRLSSSPGRWQVVWKAEGFTKQDAETLQRELAWDAGADPAATDCARVLRLPGYFNHKYSKPHWVGVERLATGIVRPGMFPAFPQPSLFRNVTQDRVRSPGSGGSQSERDWAFAKRALARGDDPVAVARAIARYRHHDKPDPQSYAERTVRKASDASSQEKARDDSPRTNIGPSR